LAAAYGGGNTEGVSGGVKTVEIGRFEYRAPDIDDAVLLGGWMSGDPLRGVRWWRHVWLERAVHWARQRPGDGDVRATRACP
jgi:hypothetical protein